MKIFAFVFALSMALCTQTALAERQFIGCQGTSASAEMLVIASFNSDSVKYFAQDEESKIRDFVGSKTRLEISDKIRLEAKAQGWDAPRFLTLTVDLAAHTITVEHIELTTDVVVYDCDSIVLAL